MIEPSEAGVDLRVAEIDRPAGALRSRRGHEHEGFGRSNRLPLLAQHSQLGVDRHGRLVAGREGLAPLLKARDALVQLPCLAGDFRRGLGARLGPGGRSERPAENREDREHRKDREQEQGDRRDEAGALAVNVAAGELAGAPGEQGQGAPDLAFEMEHAVKQIVEEGAERTVDVALLPAPMAIRSGKLGAAIQAVPTLVVRRLSRLRLDRAGDDSAGNRLADPFDARDHAPPFSSSSWRKRGPASRYRANACP